LTYEDFDYFASVLMKRWRKESTVTCQLRMELKDQLLSLKVHLSSSKENLQNYKSSIRSNIYFKKIESAKLAQLENKLVSLNKALLNIGASIPSPKQFRDLFHNIAEKVGVPLKQLTLTKQEAKIMFKALSVTMEPLLESLKIKSYKALTEAWQTLLMGIKLCLMQMWDRIKI